MVLCTLRWVGFKADGIITSVHREKTSVSHCRHILMMSCCGGTLEREMQPMDS